MIITMIINIKQSQSIDITFRFTSHRLYLFCKQRTVANTHDVLSVINICAA